MAHADVAVAAVGVEAEEEEEVEAAETSRAATSVAGEAAVVVAPATRSEQGPAKLSSSPSSRMTPKSSWRCHARSVSSKS